MAERVELRWRGHGMVFEGRRDDVHSIMIDGDAREGISPLTAFLLGIGACTAADVADIAARMRVPMGRFDLIVDGERVTDPPRRYKSLRFTYRMRGVAKSDHARIERAVSLSHEKYCSSLHTLRQDLDISTAIVFDD